MESQTTTWRGLLGGAATGGRPGGRRGQQASGPHQPESVHQSPSGWGSVH